MKQKSSSGSTRSKSGPERSKARADVKPGAEKGFKPYQWKSQRGKPWVVYEKYVTALTPANREKMDKLADTLHSENPEFDYHVYESIYQEPHYWIAEFKRKKTGGDGSDEFYDMNRRYDALKQTAKNARNAIDKLSKEYPQSQWGNPIFAEEMKTVIEDVVQFYDTVKNIPDSRINRRVRIPALVQMEQTMADIVKNVMPPQQSGW